MDVRKRMSSTKCWPTQWCLPASHSGSAFGDEHKEEQFFPTCVCRHTCTSYFQYFLLIPGLQDGGKQTELGCPFKKRLSKKIEAQ